MHIKPQQPIEAEIPFANAGIGPVDMPVERQDQRGLMFGNGVGILGRHTCDCNIELRRRIEVHIIEACAAERDKTRASLPELL